MMAGTNHANAAVGVGELYRDGAQIGMRAEFLANEWGQHERMLIKSLGEGARYSFRGRATQYSYHKDVPGVVYHAVSLYEGLPGNVARRWRQDVHEESDLTAKGGHNGNCTPRCAGRGRRAFGRQRRHNAAAADTRA